MRSAVVRTAAAGSAFGSVVRGKDEAVCFSDRRRLDRFAAGVAGLEKKAGNKLTINRFAKQDPLNRDNDLRNDWSDRVWEGKRVPKNPAKPNGPKKLEMERYLTGAGVYYVVKNVMQASPRFLSAKERRDQG